MEEILQKNKGILLDLCKMGISGRYRIPVREISIPLTNRCNNYCIMCHACSKEYENHTYHNEPPFDVTIDDYKDIVRVKKSLLEKICRSRRGGEGESNIDFLFGSAESLLNPDIYDICKYTKEVYPNSNIRIISNATIPPKKDIVRYINRIGFSVDGATKETFEKLRPPAKFDHVIKTIKKWDESADRYNNDFSFGLSVVVSSENIHEIADIVRLASEFRHIDSVFLQPIIIHDSLKHLEYMLLDNLDESTVNKAILDIESASLETGVEVDGLDSIRPTNGVKEPDRNINENVNTSVYCRYGWNGILSLLKDGTHRYFCCYMSVDDNSRLEKQYRIPSGVPIGDMYNSKAYWKFRKDMLDGKLTDCCKGCMFANAGYKALKEEEVDIDKRCYF